MIIGALGRLVLPGRQAIPIWLTIVIGIAAAIVGTLLSAAIGVASTRGIDWIELFIQIALAAVGVSLAACATRPDATASWGPRAGWALWSGSITLMMIPARWSTWLKTTSGRTAPGRREPMMCTRRPGRLVHGPPVDHGAAGLGTQELTQRLASAPTASHRTNGMAAAWPS